MVEIKQIPIGKQTVIEANRFFSLRMKAAKEAAQAKAMIEKALPKRSRK